MVFNHLDQGRKGFIDYNDFCNLSDERRMNIDPATAMLAEYKKTGQVATHTGLKQSGSPSRKEKFRRRATSSQAMHANNSSDFIEKTELDQYLQDLNLEELELVNKEKLKSTKHLSGGPTIHG